MSAWVLALLIISMVLAVAALAVGAFALVRVLKVVPLDNGGTGAKTAANARKALQLGAVAVEDVVPVTAGGTGQTTANAFRQAYLTSVTIWDDDTKLGTLAAPTPLPSNDALNQIYVTQWKSTFTPPSNTTAYQIALPTTNIPVGRTYTFIAEAFTYVNSTIPVRGTYMDQTSPPGNSETGPFTTGVYTNVIQTLSPGQSVTMTYSGNYFYRIGLHYLTANGSVVPVPAPPNPP